MPAMDRRSRREKRLDVATGVSWSAWVAVTTATLLRTVRNKPVRVRPAVSPRGVRAAVLLQLWPRTDRSCEECRRPLGPADRTGRERDVAGGPAAAPPSRPAVLASLGRRPPRFQHRPGHGVERRRASGTRPTPARTRTCCSPNSRRPPPPRTRCSGAPASRRRTPARSPTPAARSTSPPAGWPASPDGADDPDVATAVTAYQRDTGRRAGRADRPDLPTPLALLADAQDASNRLHAAVGAAPSGTARRTTTRAASPTSRRSS